MDIKELKLHFSWLVILILSQHTTVHHPTALSVGVYKQIYNITAANFLGGTLLRFSSRRFAFLSHFNVVCASRRGRVFDSGRGVGIVFVFFLDTCDILNPTIP